MATPEQIALVRRYVNEPGTEAYTDVALGALIDANDSNLEITAGGVWREKAARYAELVDVQEGSSRRALGDLYEQAIAMASSWESRSGGDGGVVIGRRAARTRQIVRP